ncbi:leucine-rich repeat domain-containing protein [Tissierella carlieri]|uniref:Leucine-rich repeat domain-containing protein n=1 Tax=Tissierella carlieri TaxID=689904 RepID=A0ABT1SCC0_9FIRM|nr:leucine-rich repeat domain-containing protein [Tissierella carlieri]MCQ4924007.1 leucine-rich repeat domain-containing protein [Tissierella carlieri]
MDKNHNTVNVTGSSIEVDLNGYIVQWLTVSGDNVTLKNGTVVNLTIQQDVKNLTMEDISDGKGGHHIFGGGGGNSIVLKGGTELKGTIDITSKSPLRIYVEEGSNAKITGNIVIKTNAAIIIAAPVKGKVEICVVNQSISIKSEVDKVVVLADATVKVDENVKIPQITKVNSVTVDAKVVDAEDKEIKKIEVEVEDSSWEIKDFTYLGTSITGFSDIGKEKFKSNKNIILPLANELGEAITEIGDKAFLGDINTKQDPKIGINSVKIPNTVTTIGEEAFRYNALTFIDIPDSVTTIKMSAFNGNKLQSLVIPDSVTNLGPGAFTLNEIADLKLSKSLETIPTAFGYNNLTTITIPEGVTRIDDLAFSDNQLVKVNLPNTLEYLSGFNNNELESIEIPKSVKELGKKALSRNKMTTITVPDNVKIIGDEAFRNTWHDKFLTSIIIEEGVEKLGKSAFAGNQLKDVYIPSSVKEIQSNAFNGNLGYDGVVHLFTPDYKNPNNLQESKYHVVNPAKLTIRYIFEDKVLKEKEIWKNPTTEQYLHIGDKNVEISPEYNDNEYELQETNMSRVDLNNKENQLVIQCKRKEIVEKITIKSILPVSSLAVDFETSKDEAINKLSRKAYIIDSNDNNHEVILTWTLEGYNGGKVGEYTAIARFELPEGISQSDPETKLEINIKIIVKEKNEDIDSSKWEVKDFIFEGTVVTGFSEQGKLKLEVNKDLVLSKTNESGENITRIEKEAFRSNQLNSVRIPEGLSGLVIGQAAFEKNQINTVFFPEGVKEIDTYAFNQNNLKYVNFPGTLKKIGNHAFAENKLISVNFSEEIEDIALDRFSFYKNQLTSVTLLKKARKVHAEAFMENTGYANDGNKVYIYTLSYDPDDNNNWFEKSNYHKVIVLSVKSVEEIKPVEIDCGTVKEEINLPRKIRLNLNNDDTKEVNITWSSEDYNSEQAGTYIFTGYYDLPEGMTGEKPEVRVEVSIKQKSDFEFSNGTITKYTGTATDVIIPEMINREKVVAIGSSVFNKKGLTSIIIPDTVESIGLSSFSNNNLTSLTLPKNLITMGNMAFYNNQLTFVKIPDGLTEIPTGAFLDNKLTSVEIPETVTRLAMKAFMDNNLETISIPSKMDNIGASAFENNYLGVVTIPVSVNVIGKKAFDGNANIKLTYSILVEAIEKAEKIETTDESEEKVQALIEAIEAGKELNENSNATLEEVNQVVKEINDAIEDLLKVDDIINTPAA